jgi:hypothetical protein
MSESDYDSIAEEMREIASEIRKLPEDPDSEMRAELAEDLRDCYHRFLTDSSFEPKIAESVDDFLSGRRRRGVARSLQWFGTSPPDPVTGKRKSASAMTCSWLSTDRPLAESHCRAW